MNVVKKTLAQNLGGLGAPRTNTQVVPTAADVPAAETKAKYERASRKDTVSIQVPVSFEEHHTFTILCAELNMYGEELVKHAVNMLLEANGRPAWEIKRRKSVRGRK